MDIPRPQSLKHKAIKRREQTGTSESTAPTSTPLHQIHVLLPTFPSECIGAVEGLPPSTKEKMPSAPLPHPLPSSVLFSPPGTRTSSLDVISARVIRVSPVVEGRQRWSGLAKSEEVTSFDSWVSLLLLPLFISLPVAVEVTSCCLGDEGKAGSACEGHVRVIVHANTMDLPFRVQSKSRYRYVTAELQQLLQL